ncbi:MAG TPA: histidine kinase [Planctomycetales bacterium]|nr:histidine kinase [Planctomycetales bacterium]
MTLVTRLSLFFLVTLAVVLAGFSAALYSLAYSHLHRQMEDRLESTLNLLASDAEEDQDGLEWEPHERLIAVGAERDDKIQWVVTDGQGNRVDASKDVDAGQPASGWDAEPWQLMRRRLQAKSKAENGERRDEERKKRFPILDIVVAAPRMPVQKALQTLAIVLSAISLVLWSSVALLGRWLCRRALTPLTRMAVAARTIHADDLGQRLPNAGTGDELEDLGRAFNDLLTRLHESFERQQRFTGDASHQLRTPLTAILGQIEVLFRRDRPVEEYDRVLKLVQKQAAHLRLIVEMLLFLARADAETKLTQLETIDLSAWLADHLQTWAAHVRTADLKWDAASVGPYWVKAQPPLLGQLVDNLLDNATKYSEAGTAVVIVIGEESGLVTLAVEDEGCGIAPDDLPHVFEAFYRSPHSHRLGIGGVGLGLAVAKRVAGALGGRLTAESQLGKGSRFTLQLPRVGVGAADAGLETRTWTTPII